MTKSGLMLGLGEKYEEVLQALQDLASAQCDIVTLGQYLQAERKKLPVKEFIHPDRFKEYEKAAYSMGFKYVYAGPFVRSSYNANLVIQRAHGKVTIDSH